VTGSFTEVLGVTSISDNLGDDNTYSLQLNTNPFNSGCCDAASDPMACSGQQQFVYYNSRGTVFISYTLHSFGRPCPSGWGEYGSDCYTSSPEKYIGTQPISDFSTMVMSGEATIGLDVLFFYYGPQGNRQRIAVLAVDSVLGLAQGGWQAAEYNVFGEGNPLSAQFNPGSSIVVAIEPTVILKDQLLSNTLPPYKSGDPYICTGGGWTSETNSLSLFGDCCWEIDHYWFFESNTDDTYRPVCFNPACVPGTRRCSGNTVETCDTNITWQGIVTCPNVCIGDGVCDTCTPGAKQCSGTVSQTCDIYGIWQTTTTCAGGCISNGVCLAPVPDLRVWAQATFEYYETEWGSREPAMKVTWQALSGSADGVLIMVGEGLSNLPPLGTIPPLVNGTPVNCPGTQDWNFGTQIFNSGWRCIYKMNGSNSGSFDIYGLVLGTRYSAAIVPYNESATGVPTYSADPSNGVLESDPPVAVPALGKSFQVALAILLCGAILFRTSRKRGNADRV
jgi:hypothetical protein